MSVDEDERDLNQIAMQAQVLQRQGGALQNQLDMLQNTLNDLQSTIDTLEQLAKAKEVGLLPIGSGAYITCKSVDTDQVMISVGAGLIVNKKAADAAEMLRKRLKTVGDAFDKGQKSLAVINQQMQDLNAQAAVLSARIDDVRPAQG